jgi:23S rRNA (uracil1939-C5)-methyltransferase
LRRRVRKTEPPARRARLAIAEIGAQGDGVGYDGAAPVFVPLTAPGDIVEAEIRGERGRLVELVEESPHRCAPPCPHYGRCGGCALQHVREDYYRAWKRERIVSALERAGLGAALVGELVSTPAASRRRATFAAQRTGQGVVLGFNERRSERIADIGGCLILHPDLLARLPTLKALSSSLPAARFDLAVTLCRNGLDVDVEAAALEEPRGTAFAALCAAAKTAGCTRLSFNGAPLVTFDPPRIEFDGVAVTPPPGAFLQASKEGEEALIALVKQAAGGARRICDLFAGCGSFALPLARRASVVAIDSDAAAIAALASAAADAQRAGLEINPPRSEVRNLFERPLTAAELRDFDAVVFDPPRAGARAQAEALAGSAVPVAIGVSCNPATFARDAAILAAGGYRLEKVSAVDQFVYSAHVELVGVFRRP